MKHKSRKRTVRKVKRLVAAVAGAAVMGSALLPIAPVAAKAVETENGKVDVKPVTKNEWYATYSSPVKAAKEQASHYGLSSSDSFSLQWKSDTEAVVLARTDDGRTYKIRLTKDKEDKDWTVSSVREISTDSGSHWRGDPVDVVRDNASIYGFDADNDRFTLLHRDGNEATVQVRTTGGQKFKVDLERKNGDWVVTVIRGIGDMNHPATYVPASMFKYRLPTTAAPIVNQSVLHSTDKYANWSWEEASYPDDLKFGVFLQNPNDRAGYNFIPASILEKMGDVDFYKQFILFAHLGDVSDNGYGIGIEKVVQAGNDLTVTIRANSPGSPVKLKNSIKDDFIIVDRASLNFERPIHINFVDQLGRTLSNFTIVRGK